MKKRITIGIVLLVLPGIAWSTPARQRYFFTAEIAENAENNGLLWPLLSRSPAIVTPFPCFLPRALSRPTPRPAHQCAGSFSAFSAPSAVKSRVVGLE